MYGFKTKTAKAITKWLEANDFTCICKLDKTEFAYDLWDDEIFIPKEYRDELSDYYFYETLLKMGLKNKNVSVYTLSILHEIGHAETLPFLDEIELTFCNLKADEAEEQKYFTVEEGLTAYWNTPREKMANEWAVKTANEFPEAVADLDEIVKSGLIVGE